MQIIKIRHSSIVFFTIIISCLFFSCEPNKEYKSTNKHVTIINSLNRTNEAKSILDLFELKNIVELKTEPDKVIGKIKRIKVVDDNIFIFDNIRNTVYRFDLEGRFLNFIGQKGGGPKEFVHAIDFCVDTTTEEVHILDNEKKILRYKLDGEFIEKIDIPVHASFIVLRENNTYLLISTASNYGRYMFFYVVNKNGKVIDERIPFAEKNIKSSFSLISGISELKSEYTMCFPLNDTIYSYYEEDLHPKYFFDFENEKLADEIYCNYTDEFDIIKEMEKRNKVLYISNYLETENLCYAIYVKGKNLLNTVIYSKTTRKTYYYNGKNIGDILNGGFTCSTPKGDMIYVLNTYFPERSGLDLRIRTMDGQYKDNRSYQQIKEQCLKVGTLENPSILIFQPKPNI
ncbi:6-bladed beta-propeller [Draconibacterium sp. IB214405]|uniref:6-bladed beta-propeller n=1 Tax=Draconibacterium sp. IB214405 TaxID=3097352 RepID=UPI002A0E6443|nr:6-bladed beta-propeller [Draconibacterium sp. IB214405]MDX8339750.1 6-bladed beta-propeller [Draconibacterium sp. IB214405]